MSPLAPETAASPIQEAPPDRPTTNLEQWARQGIALLFGDRVLDMNERRILRAFMEEVAMRAQSGGIGNGVTPGAQGAQGGPPESPAAMNQNTEDVGTVAGAEAEYPEGY